jgi:hypothetical protein
MTFSIEEIVVLVVGIVLAAAGLSQIPRLWRNDGVRFSSTPSWWLWGDALFRGWLRARVVAVVTFLVLILIVASGVGGSQAVTDGSSALIKYAFDTAIVGFTALFFVGIVLWLAVILLNRPKLLVPPASRREPGAIHVWFKRPSRGAR